MIILDSSSLRERCIMFISKNLVCKKCPFFSNRGNAHRHTFEMKGLNLGTAKLMALLVLGASVKKKNYLRSGIRNEDKMSEK